MSRKHPAIPKGRACGLQYSDEYKQGFDGFLLGLLSDKNPYDFFDEYEEYYAWDIGWQNAKNREKGLRKWYLKL